MRRYVLDELDALSDQVSGSRRYNTPGLIAMVNQLRGEVLRLQSRVLFLTILVGILMATIIVVLLGLLDWPRLPV